MSNKGSGFHYQGFQNPNYTMVPDDLFDVLAPELSGAELRVLLYIIRRTFGFKKPSDNISFSQLVDGIKTRDGHQLDRGTGLSRASVAIAVKGLVEKGIILAAKNQSVARGNEPTTYSLNVLQDPWSKNQTRGSLKNGQGLVQKLDPQETVLQETVEQQHVGVVEHLTEFGVTKAVAEDLAARFPEEHILAKLDLVQWLVESKSPLVAKNPAGYLRRAIEDDYQPPRSYQSPQQRAEEDQRKSQRQQLEQELRARAEQSFKLAREAHRKAVDEHYPPQPISGTSHTTATAWSTVLADLRHQMTAANFETWFTHTSLISCDDKTAVIVGTSGYQVDWLSTRFTPLIRKTLLAILGFPVECRFIAAKQLEQLPQQLLPAEQDPQPAPPPQRLF